MARTRVGTGGVSEGYDPKAESLLPVAATGRPDDALAILTAQRSAIRQTAASVYSPAIIDEWAPAIIVTERVETFLRRIELGEELIVVAMDSVAEIGFGSIVPG